MKSLKPYNDPNSKKKKRFFIKWLGRMLTRLFVAIKNLILQAPARLKGLIFRFAAWGQRQLDKRFNSEQREHLHTIIFKTDTPEAKRFDTILTWIIILSTISTILETVHELSANFFWLFFILEWIFTIIFTVEYIFRLYAARNTLRYATSFFGMVDLLSIIPTFLSIFFLGAQNLIVIRALRLLRIFRIFKMGHFVSEGQIILSALRASRTKIYVFISFVLLMAMIIGSVLYIVEGGTNPSLDNIPKGIYWAIVTLTTVGYGDVTPITAFGKFLAAMVMVMGYGVIAVPTGIVTAEISGRVMNLKEVMYQHCDNCGQDEHHTGGVFCHVCGDKL